MTPHCSSARVAVHGLAVHGLYTCLVAAPGQYSRHPLCLLIVLD